MPGWDCLGLAIEGKIEEEYRKGGRDKDAVDMVEFRQECRRFAEGWVDVQREEFKRLGITGKWDDPYLTMDYHAEAVIAAEFMKLLMNGSLYQGSKPVMWSPVEQTALAEAEPSEADLKAAYDKAFGASVAPKTEYNAAHILVATEDEAKAIVTQLEGGADFGTIAEEKSSDNSSANKGDLGWFTPDQMVEPFANAVVALEKGQVSAPVQSQFGWHVIKLLDERTQAAPAFDEVRDQLATQVRRDRVAAEIERIAAAAKVEKTEGLDPALLGSTDITKN